jgi:hypothetical protein
MAQLLHASSTGFLVILSAPRVTPGQEALWYAIYAAVLWAVMVTVVSLQHRLPGLAAAEPPQQNQRVGAGEAAVSVVADVADR